MFYDETAERARDRQVRQWKFRATFVHDITLPPATWTIDGEVQEGRPTAEVLEALPLRTVKPRIACSAPHHLDIGRVTGFLPPYDPMPAR